MCCVKYYTAFIVKLIDVPSLNPTMHSRCFRLISAANIVPVNRVFADMKTCVADHSCTVSKYRSQSKIVHDNMERLTVANSCKQSALHGMFSVMQML